MDKYGRDVMEMSDFFDGYVHQMAIKLKKESSLELVRDLPISNLGIINEVVHHANIVINRGITLVPDFDSLPNDIKGKLESKFYSIAESKQVDGNLRPVILDENGVRIKDITLKKITNKVDNIETLRNISNQLQMQQIYAKLADIQEFQMYQIETDRDRDFIVPFLDARSLILESKSRKTEDDQTRLVREADGKIRTALTAIYQNIDTTSKSFAKKVNYPFLQPFGNPINTYMRYLTDDLQLATKYVGVRLQLLEHIGDNEASKEILQQYHHVIHDFLTKPLTRKGLTAATLMHDYFPYDKTNINCWHTFSTEMIPAIEQNMEKLKLKYNDDVEEDIYIVSLEDSENE
ncbi:hypothetical protein HZR21_05475 [Lactococcus laudensis]|uniref:Uncharacterized protein n=1 Tax=Pseudolactococcus laudensis TaxID=1494461 RepID=A0A7V8N0Z0_9LACT|nr:hypothetical protein [Lactococcus laudensis]MBA0016599.1 hypothetical protein [Lactococcus laudensis]MBW9281304.1 hypothetical protein [Lactococcus laudensis]